MPQPGDGVPRVVAADNNGQVLLVLHDALTGEEVPCRGCRRCSCLHSQQVIYLSPQPAVSRAQDRPLARGLV